MKFSFCKKQYVYIGLAVVSISLAITSHVFAQEPNTNAAERTESVLEEVAERRAVISEKIQDRIINLARNMQNRMNAAIERLTQITNRAESRINKLSNDGIDTAQASTILALAQAEIDEAKASLASIDGTVIDAVTSDRPREAFKSVKESFRDAAHSIRDAQTHLRTIVALLKEAVAAEGSGVSDAVRQDVE